MKSERMQEPASQVTGSPREVAGFLKIAKEAENGSRCSTPTEVIK